MNDYFGYGVTSTMFKKFATTAQCHEGASSLPFFVSLWLIIILLRAQPN